MRKWLKRIIKEALHEAFLAFLVQFQKVTDRGSPIELFTRLTADEVVRYGEALDELAQGGHYKYLVELVKRRRAQVGELALQGGGPSLDYWKGFRDGAESLEILVDPMRKNAQKLLEEHKTGGATLKEFLGMSEGPLV